MKRLIVISIMSLVSFCVYGQSIGVRNLEAEKPIELDLKVYDNSTLTLKFRELMEHPHYYDNQRIIIAPNTDPSLKYDYYEGFYLRDSVEMVEYSDTVWLKRRKKIKEGDYYIRTPKTNAYKAENVDNGIIRIFGGREYNNAFKRKTGFFTPKEAVEGQVFTIKTSRYESISGCRIFYLELENENDGTSLILKCQDGNSYDDEIRPSVLMMSYIEKYQSQYLGKTFHLGNFSDNRCWAGKDLKTGRYRIVQGNLTCTEISFIKGDEKVFTSNIEGYTNVYNTDIGLFFKDEGGNEYCSSLLGQKSSLWLSYSDVKDMEGYDGQRHYYEIRLEHMVDIDTYNEQVKQARREEQVRETERERLAAERKMRLVKKFGKSNADIILQGKVRIGMTAEMCQEAWGRPEKINRSTGSWGVHEQWVYGDGNYLYMEDGILSSIQN